VGHVARTGEMRNAYKILVGKPEGKRPFGRPRSGWEDNFKTSLRGLVRVDVLDSPDSGYSSVAGFVDLRAQYR